MQLPEECNFKYPELFWKEKANQFTATIDSKIFKAKPFNLGEQLNHWNNYTFVYFQSKDGQVDKSQHEMLMTFLENQERFRKEMEEAIQSYLHHDVKKLMEPSEYNELMNENSNELVLLHHVHVPHQDNRNIGFEFECSWDVEHGFGIKYNGESISKVGAADVAF